MYTKTAAGLLLVLASSSSFAAVCFPELIIKNRPGFASESDNGIINAEELHSDAPSDDTDTETSALTEDTAS